MKTNTGFIFDVRETGVAEVAADKRSLCGFKPQSGDWKTFTAPRDDQ